MSTPVDNNALAQPILTAIESGAIRIGYILGAALGMALKKHAHIDLKAHKNLHAFCDNYVGQYIKHLGRIAPATGDSLYYVYGNTTVHTDWCDINRANAKLIWDFYSNPLLGARLAINQQDASCWATLNPAAPTKQNMADLPGISIATLENLISTYIAQCPAELKPTVTEASKIASKVGPSIADAWPTVIQTARFATVLGDWEQWLLRALIKQDTNKIAPAWLTELLNNYIRERNQLKGEFTEAGTTSPPTSPTNMPHAAQDATNIDSTPPKLREARAIAINVIQGMSYEQLRELNLPFGMVLDALAVK